MKKESNAAAYFSMWKNIFNYKGKAMKREYWVPFIVHLILVVIAVALTIWFNSYYSQPLPLFIVAVVLFAFLMVSIIPWIALCVRTARSFGGASWWRVLLFAIGAGAVILLFFAFIMNADFVPAINRPETVYGPPEWFGIETSSESSYDPEENIIEDVYGPPEWFEDGSVSVSSYDPENNVIEGVYGPPEWFGKNSDTTAASNSETYDPSENEPETVYGPPEWFE